MNWLVFFVSIGVVSMVAVLGVGLHIFSASIGKRYGANAEIAAFIGPMLLAMCIFLSLIS